MQMRKFCYENGSKRQRAARLREEGREDMRRGFACMGQVALELADWLDWTPDEAVDANGESSPPSH